MGGPPLVSLTRVKVGGSDENEEEERRIRLIITLPRPVHRLQIIVFTSDDFVTVCISPGPLVGFGGSRESRSSKL